MIDHNDRADRGIVIGGAVMLFVVSMGWLAYSIAQAWVFQ